MKDKLLKTMLLLLLPLVFAGQAVGQTLEYGFAGEDKTVLYDCSQPSTLVSLGDMLASPSDAQFHWEVVSTEGESIFAVIDENTRHAPVAVVSIYSENGLGSVRFCCTRVSHFGYQKEYVTVNLTNKFVMLATPKDNCWGNGDDITIEQFEIETVPPGNECYVMLDENSQKARNSAGSVYEVQEIHFISCDENHPLDESGATTRILVIRASDNFSAQAALVPSDLKKKIDIFRTGVGLKEKLRYIEILTEPLKKHGPISFVPSVTPNVGISYGMSCCNGAETKYMKLSGNITASGTFDLTIRPVAFPLLQFYIAFSGSLAVGLPEVKFTYSTGVVECVEVAEVPFSFTGELEGGVALTGGSRDFLSISASIIGGMTCPGLFYLTYSQGELPQTKIISMTFYAKIKLQAVTPLATFSKPITFAEKECFGDY